MPTVVDLLELSTTVLECGLVTVEPEVENLLELDFGGLVGLGLLTAVLRSQVDHLHEGR